MLCSVIAERTTELLSSMYFSSFFWQKTTYKYNLLTNANSNPCLTAYSLIQINLCDRLFAQWQFYLASVVKVKISFTIDTEEQITNTQVY